MCQQLGRSIDGAGNGIIHIRDGDLINRMNGV